MHVATTHANTNHLNPAMGTLSMSRTPSRAPTIDATAKTTAGAHDTNPAHTKIPSDTEPNAIVITNLSALPVIRL
jgi:hypothetical protein